MTGRPVPPRGDDGFHHPSSEDDLVALVELARERVASLRVRGSAHSIAPAIYTDGRLAGADDGGVDVMLDRYAELTFDDAAMRVTAQAGCHLGLDPRDPTLTSTWATSLLAQLDARGWALPDLGGVSHQTVSGFLMTGSCGGSVQHGIEESVVAIRFVDGLGRVHDVHRDRDELFDAVACSMGLLGVISTITFQCVPRYDILGREDIRAVDGCDYEPFGDGERGFEAFLRRTEYARLMWWPQRGVERVVTWQARRMEDADYAEETGPRGALRPKPYNALGDDVPTEVARPASLAAQWIGGKFYDALDLVGSLRREGEKKLPSLKSLGQAASALFSEKALPAVLNQFVPIDELGPQRFWDSWYDGLPMDNQMSEESLPTTFTEIFVDLADAGRAMRALRDHFERGGIEATGNYCFEIYAGRANRLWLHPSHGRDSLRIDVFWFERNTGDPTAFFTQFWDLFAPFGFRLHWGKHLMAPARTAAYLRDQFPRWDDFLRARAELDPDGIFLNQHLAGALGVPMPARRGAAP